MKTYLVCDQDAQVFQDGDAWNQHFIDNPTHTSHIGVGGDTSSPTNYAGSSGNISEVATDPASPTAGQIWLLHNNTPTGGSPLGLLLTLTQTFIDNQYLLSIRTNENTTVRTVLI